MMHYAVKFQTKGNTRKIFENGSAGQYLSNVCKKINRKTTKIFQKGWPPARSNVLHSQQHVEINLEGSLCTLNHCFLNKNCRRITTIIIGNKLDMSIYPI